MGNAHLLGRGRSPRQLTFKEAEEPPVTPRELSFEKANEPPSIVGRFEIYYGEKVEFAMFQDGEAYEDADDKLVAALLDPTCAAIQWKSSREGLCYKFAALPALIGDGEPIESFDSTKSAEWSWFVKKESDIGPVKRAEWLENSAWGNFYHQSVRDDEEVVLAYAKRNSTALWHASSRLRSKKRVVVSAAACRDRGGKSDATRFALAGLDRDRDVLRAAGLLFERVEDASMEKDRVVVLSERSTLTDEMSSRANYLLLRIRKRQSDKPDGTFSKFSFYSPADFMTGFCQKGGHAEFADAACPCRGIHPSFEEVGSCGASDCLMEPFPNGRPKSHSVDGARACWRYALRWHLENAHRKKGVFVQLIDDGQLGEAQMFEEVIAQQVGIKIVQLDAEGPFQDTMDALEKELEQFLRVML